MTGLRSVNDSTSKRVLNLLETGYVASQPFHCHVVTMGKSLTYMRLHASSSVVIYGANYKCVYFIHLFKSSSFSNSR